VPGIDWTGQASERAGRDPDVHASSSQVVVGVRTCISFRLVALVVLYVHTLKPNILPGHHDFPVQHQFSRTRHPLYLLLHTNKPQWDPLVSLLTSLSTRLLLSPPLFPRAASLSPPLPPHPRGAAPPAGLLFRRPPRPRPFSPHRQAAGRRRPSPPPAASNSLPPLAAEQWRRDSSLSPGGGSGDGGGRLLLAPTSGAGLRAGAGLWWRSA
jgi:hypothetical protein